MSTQRLETGQQKPPPGVTEGLLCGVWPGRRGLSAVLIDKEGGVLTASMIAAASVQDSWELLERIDSAQGLDWQLVLPRFLARRDPLAQVALDRNVPVWVVPEHVVEAVRLLGSLERMPANRIAAAIARIPTISLFTSQLRRLQPPDRRQLRLL